MWWFEFLTCTFISAVSVLPVKEKLSSLLSQEVLLCLSGIFVWYQRQGHFTMATYQNRLVAAAALLMISFFLIQSGADTNLDTASRLLFSITRCKISYFLCNESTTRKDTSLVVKQKGEKKKLVSHPAWQWSRSKLQRRMGLIKWLV